MNHSLIVMAAYMHAHTHECLHTCMHAGIHDRKRACMISQVCKKEEWLPVITYDTPTDDYVGADDSNFILLIFSVKKFL